ncbi:MAG: hemolysin family protein [Defluviitaleaceae bacterium]|nr:hemolysin family protein [Defluviitaleaceae bacterium]
MLAQTFILLIFILINGIVTGAELAILSTNNAKLNKEREEGDKKKKQKVDLILTLRDNSSFLPSIAIAYTLIGTFTGVFSSTVFAAPLIAWLLSFDYFYSIIGSASIESIVVLIITIGVSIVSIIFSETVPKRIALSYPEKTALITIKSVYILCKILKPFSFILGKAATAITKIMRIKEKDRDEPASEDDIRIMVEDSVVNEDEKEMIENIFDLNDTIVEEISTHRTEIISLNVDHTEEELQEVLRSEHSRIPVYEENIDNIIGILHVKDVMKELIKDMSLKDINTSSIIREPYKVPHSKKINELLGEMQASKKQIAIVIDEYGGTFGIVTMEDIIEEVIGPIFDEYDNETKNIEEALDGKLIINGITPIEDVEEVINFSFSEEDKKDYDTIGGFIIGRLGRIPTNEEDVSYTYKDSVVFEIRGIYENRIQELIITILDNTEELGEEN